MKVAVIGLGKVGLPLALVLRKHGGHEVVGYDIDAPRVAARVTNALISDDPEPGVSELLRAGQGPVAAVSMEEVVRHAEVVFVVVQTLHGAGYGGETPMPAEPADFDYTQLAVACQDLRVAARAQRKQLTVAVVSTVLPGTIRRELMPPGDADGISFVYNPALISLGSVVEDLLYPDFVLIGADDDQAAKQVAQAWVTVNTHPPFHFTSVASAELLKVALNAYLSTKITFANTLAQLCHAIPGANVDEVTDGLKLSRKALGPFGLTAGLGDGGPCRPRDLAALSWLAEQAELPADPFTSLIRLRESQTQRLAWLTANAAIDHDLPVVQLGWTYKPGSALPDGSPARLLQHYLEELGHRPAVYDRVMFPGYWPPPPAPAVFVLAVPHPEFEGFEYPAGSVVIDPHGVVKGQDGITVVRVGRR